MRGLFAVWLAAALLPSTSRAQDAPTVLPPSGPPEIVVVDPEPPKPDEPEVVTPPPASPTLVVVEAPPAQDPGTHFILEADLGATLTGGGGFACDALFGWGGTPFGLPTPLYVYGGATFTTMDGGGSIRSGTYQDERNFLDLVVGLRLYVPIGPVFRLFADASLGAVLAVSHLERELHERLQEDGWYFAGTLGGGVQVRLLREVSFGVGVQVLLTDDDLSAVRGALGARDEVPVRLRGSATWHF